MDEYATEEMLANEEAERIKTEVARLINARIKPLADDVTIAMIGNDIPRRDKGMKIIEELNGYKAAAEALFANFDAVLNGTSTAGIPRVIFGQESRGERTGRGPGRPSNSERSGSFASTSKREMEPFYLRALLFMPNESGTNRQIQHMLFDIMVAEDADKPGDGEKMTSGHRYIKTSDHTGLDFTKSGLLNKDASGVYTFTELGRTRALQLQSEAEKRAEAGGGKVVKPGDHVPRVLNPEARAKDARFSNTEVSLSDSQNPPTLAPSSLTGALPLDEALAATQAAPEPVSETPTSGGFGEPPAE